MGKEQEPEFLTAQVCLEFANTISYRHSPHPQEHLPDYLSLLDWAAQSGGLDEQAADRLRALTSARPAEARQAFAEALELRETIYRLLAARTTGSKAAEADLRSFNLALGQSMAHAQLTAGAVAYDWSWEDRQNPSFERPCWLAARSAAVLLTSPDLLERLGRCADPQCGWLFLDTSRSRTRRWCDIGDCGNRAKQRRFRKKRINHQL